MVNEVLCEKMKEVLCEKVEEARRLSDKEMAAMLFFEEDVLRLIRGYASQGGRSSLKKFFYGELKMKRKKMKMHDF